jgi:tol-pal system protein YbgF
VRTRWIALALGAMFFGAVGGSILAPQPAGAVSKEMIELQQQVGQLLQGQQDLRSTVDSNNAALRTLVQQSLDSVNRLSGEMGNLQKTVQEVQANTGSRIDTMTQQSQGISDNMQDVQARVAKLAQQLNDMQNLLQSIDSKVSGGGVSGPPNGGNSMPTGGGAPNNMPPPTNGGAPSGAAMNPGSISPISADTLYQNALRDLNSGHYDLAQQEFSDYIHNFPANDLASNAQFYLGEVAYAQGDYKSAIAGYDTVLAKYPGSLKLGASLLKKGMAEIQLGMKASGIRDLHEVVRKFPGSDESRRAEAKLRELGAAGPAHTPARQ